MSTEIIESNRMPLTARDIRKHVNLIQEVMRAVMKEGVHFGIIPGCPKHSLFKPGAETIASTFRIAIDSQVEDLSTPDEKRYRVTCVAWGVDGNKLGSSVGECSSNEEKFRWRRPVCNREWEEADVDRKREKWLKDESKIKQIRTEPSDLANTILQMADKRAYVSVVRKVTAASDVFTQDVEDLPEEIRQEAADASAPAGKPAVKMPTEKNADSITYTDIISLSQAQLNDVLNLRAFLISVSTKKVSNGTKDVSDYVIGDLPKDPTLKVTIRAFGLPAEVAEGNPIKLKGVKVSEFNGGRTYLASEVIGE